MSKYFFIEEIPISSHIYSLGQIFLFFGDVHNVVDVYLAALQFAAHFALMHDEYAIGQAFQMFMLATVIEGRLIDINPYWQPGVEAYKKNMTAILAKK